ncbi:MAG: LacI family transcriptional regulator, partial [Actinobacteria bacterium]|nr:LacI family transcriptional regulator [Actinomycetota bacterium]
MSATIQDVAKKARVSVTTVSRVLNGSLAVRPQTKEWVLRVVKELGYSPNLLARSLKNRTSHTIGLVALLAYK